MKSLNRKEYHTVKHSEVVLVGVGLIAIAACLIAFSPDARWRRDGFATEPVPAASPVTVFSDAARGVTCWAVMQVDTPPAISCLPNMWLQNYEAPPVHEELAPRPEAGQSWASDLGSVTR